jgi:trimethylamine:corrinoid methyltransferase-like protein
MLTDISKKDAISTVLSRCLALLDDRPDPDKERTVQWHINTLAPESVERIHQQALDLLDRHGIRMHNHDALDLLADCGACVAQETVRIPPP